jgi:3-oxoacyl-[acyl-carrier protein] reductase
MSDHSRLSGIREGACSVASASGRPGNGHLETKMTEQASKVAIVTGASRGIGATVAERLAQDGFTVVVNYAGGAAEAEAVVARIKAAGGNAITAQADVSDPAAMRRMFDAAETAFGGVDVLVNNAGVMALAPLADVTDEDFDRLIAINLKGVFNGLREAARRLRDGGRIVSFSTSIMGTLLPTYGVYAATKGGVEAMTRILSKELGKRQITVNAIAPGPVGTELFLNGKSPELIERLANMAPLARLGAPADIADAISFLVGPQGGWINGQVLRANGGMV